MDYQLLVAWRVVELLETLPIGERQRLRVCLRRIETDLSGMTDDQESDATGRSIEIHVCASHAFKYWIDPIDRQFKVLDMYPADRTRS